MPGTSSHRIPSYRLHKSSGLADGNQGIIERMQSILEDAASRFPALLEGVNVGPGATLDPEELTRRAASLGEEGEAQVMSGLGELVAYLEFEVMNHPGIDDPDGVLRSVADLRSSLG